MSEFKKHPDWEKENSLTSPSDRDINNKWRPEQGNPALSESEVKYAMDELNNTNFVEKFQKTDRTYADPPITMQNIGLISFTPAKGATPNKNGVYGFAKLRGNYATNMEADQRAEFLIRNVDSYHQIYHTYVGRPFPITFSSKYSAETKEIDIRRETTESVSSNIKQQKDDERKTVNEIKERETALLSESKTARDDDGKGDVPETDPYEDYITQCVKKAQLTWTFLEHLKKLKEVRDIILNTRDKISKLDEKHPDFKEKYFNKYMDARKSAGLDEKVRETQDNFMKYMVQDISIPTIDTDEILPEIKENKLTTVQEQDEKEEEKQDKKQED